LFNTAKAVLKYTSYQYNVQARSDQVAYSVNWGAWGGGPVLGLNPGPKFFTLFLEPIISRGWGPVGRFDMCWPILINNSVTEECEMRVVYLHSFGRKPEVEIVGNGFA